LAVAFFQINPQGYQKIRSGLFHYRSSTGTSYLVEQGL
jgi:hypothetical protein